MEIFKLCITVFIYLIFPVAGITAYVLLLKKMRREQVPHIPKLSYWHFSIFMEAGS